MAKTLSIGDTGPEVLNWQRYLISQGFDIVPDSKFGPSTLAATRAMQRKMGIKPDGKVGHRTIGKSETPLPTPRPVSSPMPFAAQPGGPTPAFQSSGPEADLTSMHSAASNRTAEDQMAQELMGQNYDARAADLANQQDAPPPMPTFASDATASMPGLLMAGKRAQGVDPNFSAASDPATQLDVSGMGLGGQPGAGLSAGIPVDPRQRDMMIRMLLQGAGA